MNKSDEEDEGGNKKWRKECCLSNLMW
jgi:hypothetical protein